MTARMLLGNVASFGLQVTVLVAAGAALARTFRIDEPRTMLAYWRTLLLACLLLPLCQPWNTVIPPALSTTTVVTTGSAAAPAGAVAPVPSRSVSWPIGDLVLIGLAAGIAARMLWLTIGAYGLRRLRRDASPLDPLPESVRHAQERIGTRAGMYVSDRVSGPITFGLLRPVVLFPPSVSAMPAHVQQAIAYHELLHVKRRDWLYEILEEAVRSVLWFHPAIWWLIGRIRLTREQVVDQAAIRLTDSKERYVESLLAVALASSSPAAFTPASAFLRRHLLKKRVARILQETTMTTRRLIASLAASAAVLALAGTLAVRSFPLEAQGRAPADNGEPIQLVRGGEHLLHGERPEYPRRAVEQKVEGDVVVEMTLNDRGEVSDARVVSGPEELRKATLEAVLQWHYSPAAINSTVTHATLRFHLSPAVLETAELSKKLRVAEGVETLRSWAVASPKHAENRVIAIEKALEDPATTNEQRAELEAKHVEMTKLIEKIRVDHHKEPLVVVDEIESHELKNHELKHELSGNVALTLVSGNVALKLGESEKPRERKFEGTWRLAGVRGEGVSDATVGEILAQAGVAVGDAITEATEKRIQEVARAMDEHFEVEFRGNEDTGRLSITIRAR